VIQHADRIVVFREGRVTGQLASNEATAESIAALALPVELSSPEAPAHARTAPSGPWWSSQHALAMAILLLATALACTRDAFLTRSNLETLATNTAGLAILSLGAAAIILAGAIDISLGSLLALAAGVVGLVLEQPGAPAVVVPLGIAAGLAVGLAGGLANAGLSLLGRIHPIVVTLGTMTVYRALLISLTGGETIAGLPREFTRLTGTLAPGVTGATIVGLVVAAGMYAWSTYRRSGRYLLAYGSSPSAARLVGIRQTRVWLLAFSTGGLLAAVAGLLELAQTGAMQSSLGVGYELQAIAAAVIGGVSISGGRGSVLGVCLGAVLLSLIHNAFVLWQIPGQQYSLVTGGLLLGAILLDAPWRRGRA
jgi:ribose/xylose/arabinose/galactoside ABC-type transport system permease subunit